MKQAAGQPMKPRGAHCAWPRCSGPAAYWLRVLIHQSGTARINFTET